MSTPLEAFTPELTRLQGLCQGALMAGKVRLLAYGQVSPEYSDVWPVEDDISVPDVEAARASHVALGELPGFVTAGPAFLAAEEVESTLNHLLDSAMYFSNEYGSDQALKGLRHFVGRVTNTANVFLFPAGHVRVLELYEDGGQELITISSVTINRDGRVETVVLVTHPGGILDARMVGESDTALSASDYEACTDMFGQGSLAGLIFLGRFETEAELESSLASIRGQTLSTGVYEEQQVDAVLAIVRRHALRSPQETLELTSERLARFNNYVATLIFDKGVAE